MRTYGLRFRAFAALDAGGPLTRQALEAGDIGAALLFTTDPAIRARHLVELADNRDLQPAENVLPVLRRATADRYGPGLLAALDAVSARLSTDALTALNAQVEVNGRDPRAVARSWLREQGLLGAGANARAPISAMTQSMRYCSACGRAGSSRSSCSSIRAAPRRGRL